MSVAYHQDRLQQLPELANLVAAGVRKSALDNGIADPPQFLLVKAMSDALEHIKGMPTESLSNLSLGGPVGVEAARRFDIELHKLPPQEIVALQSGIPLNLTQRWLGHARPSTTAIYADACGPEEIAFAERFWCAPGIGAGQTTVAVITDHALKGRR